MLKKIKSGFRALFLYFALKTNIVFLGYISTILSRNNE